MEFPYPVKRKFRDGEKATLDDLKWGRQIAAEIVSVNPDALPIFLRLDHEIISLEKRMSDLERAKLIAKNGLHFG